MTADEVAVVREPLRRELDAAQARIAELETRLAEARPALGEETAEYFDNCVWWLLEAAGERRNRLSALGNLLCYAGRRDLADSVAAKEPSA